MASSYPGSLDSFSTSHADGVAEVIHAATINDNADAINKIEAALGVNPFGTFSTVAAKLNALYYGSVNTAGRNAITSPAKGLTVFNTDSNRYEFNAGTSGSPSWSSFTSAFATGTLAGRPAAGSSNANSWYFASDDNGGTLYYSDGSTWTKVAPGITQQQTPIDGSVTTAKLAANAVTTAKLAASSVTSTIVDTSVYASPALTGTPTAPTASVGTNTTQIATTAFVLANSGVTRYSKLTSKAVNTTVSATDLLNGEITIGASVFTAGKKVTAELWGDMLNNTGSSLDTPRIQFVFGGTTLIDTGTSTATGWASVSSRSGWHCKIDGIATGASQQYWNFEFFMGGPNPVGTGNSNWTIGQGTSSTHATGSGIASYDMMGSASSTAASGGTIAFVVNTINPSANVNCEMRLLGAIVDVT